MSEEKEPLRMDAYYYGFMPTGVELVDRILSAIAHAGRGYHHTEGWAEPQKDCGPFRGGDYVSWIQNAASDAARALISVEAENAALRQQVQSLRNELTQIRQGHMGKEDGFLCVLGGSGADYRCPQCVSIDATLASSQTETKG